MREHIRILGILNMVMGGLAALGAGVVLIAMGGAAKLVSVAARSSDQDAAAAPIIAMIGVGIAIFLLILAAPAIIGGWGLLNFRPWSRVLMIVLSILNLFHIPLGTALGVYGLWVLFSDDGRRLLATGGQVFQPVPASPPVPAASSLTYPMPPPAP